MSRLESRSDPKRLSLVLDHLLINKGLTGWYNEMYKFEFVGSTFVFSRIATYRNLLLWSNVVKIVVNVVKVFKGKPSDLSLSVYGLGNFQFALQALDFLLLELFCHLVVNLHCGFNLLMTHNIHKDSIRIVITHEDCKN